MFEAALFDMDGLLLDTERVYLRTFLQTATDLKFPHPDLLEGVFQNMVGLRAKDSDNIMQAEVGQHVDLTRFNTLWKQHTADALASDIPVQSTVRETLSELKLAGVPCAVATSTRTSIAIEHLDRACIGSFFDVVIGGEQVSKGKPDPEIYLRAAEALGMNPIKCAAFEDSNNGIRAAVASGAKSVQVPDMVPPTEAVRALGHVIADDLISGAQQIGLLT